MGHRRDEARCPLDQVLCELDTTRWNVQDPCFSVAYLWAQHTAEKAAKAYLWTIRWLHSTGLPAGVPAHAFSDKDTKKTID